MFRGIQEELTYDAMSIEHTRLVIDRELCAGHGRCYSLAPDLVDADDEGYPIVLDIEPNAETIARLRKLLVNCPEKALALAPQTAS